MVDVKDLLLPLLCLRCKNERNLLLYWKKKNNLLLDQTSKRSNEFLSFSDNKRERNYQDKRGGSHRVAINVTSFSFSKPHTHPTHTPWEAARASQQIKISLMVGP